jgi:hypothetical protein
MSISALEPTAVPLLRSTVATIRERVVRSTTPSAAVALFWSVRRNDFSIYFL